MERMSKFLKKKWVIELIGLLALSALIWFIGPLVAIAGSVPLESDLVRGIFIVVLFVLWLLYCWLRRHLAAQRESSLVKDLAVGEGDGALQDAQAATAAELNVLKRGFDEALALLKSTGGKQRAGQQHLYELPWYAIIGAPGSGKTTALINSGLHFPLAEKLGKYAVKGVSGTRDCDWWFSDEAVLLDTAGRYVTQDSHKEVDASAWLGFLQLLKKYRPRRPLNGVFVAVSVSDLLQQTEEQVRQHAAAIRQRIIELNANLGVQLPIYVLLTKADLLAGFSDFFANLSDEERAQVWGQTFSSWGNVELTQNLLTFDREYDELLARLLQRRLKRLQEERDVQRRAAIFDFPTQMLLLKPGVTKFLEAVFSANRYEEPLLLRGAYFTSGTQEGTPIDRVMGALAASYRLDRQAIAYNSGRGKSYFLSKLLKQVIFPEAELVGVDRQVERRFRLLSMGGAIAAAVLVILVLLGWFVSFAANQSAIAEVEKQIEIYHTVGGAAANDSQGNLLALLPRLNALAAAHEVFPQTAWYAGLGLYQGDKINAGVDVAYQRLLREPFATLLTQRLKERMQGAEGNNLEVLYQLLRVYLMFAEPKRMDAKVAQAWLSLDWQRSFTTDPETQAKLQTHLDNLLALSIDPVAVDQSFVTAVRVKLSQTPMSAQIYGQFKSDALFDHAHDINIAAQLNPNGGRVYMVNGKELDSLSIPGLFTAYGYTDLFLKKAKDTVKQAHEQNWVLGNQASDSQAETERLYGDFLRLYLADYQKQWDAVLATVKIRPQQTNNQIIETLDLLSRPDSPLKLLLQTVEKNTALSRLSAEAAALGGLSKAVAGAASALPDSMTQKMLDLAKNQVNAGTDPVKALEDHFEPYNQQVRMAADRPAAIDATLATLKNLHDYLLQASSSPDKKASLLPGGAPSPVQAAKREIEKSLPGPVAASLSNLTSAGGNNLKSDAKSQLNDSLKTSVYMPCTSALAGRYPFARNTPQDVLLSDFVKIFAAGGVMDQYFNSNLKALVDTAAVQWKELSSENELGLSPMTLRQFQIAARIRDAFFAGGGGNPQVKFELKPIALDDRVGTFRLNIEGQELLYQHGPEQISQFQWPGVNSSAGVRLVFETLDGKQVSRFKEGSWALFRMFDEFNIERTALPEKFNLTVQVEGLSARFELRAASVNNPFGLTEYQSFRCPEAL